MASSTGNVISVPAPTIAFMVPATMPARVTTSASSGVIVARPYGRAGDSQRTADSLGLGVRGAARWELAAGGCAPGRGGPARSGVAVRPAEPADDAAEAFQRPTELTRHDPDLVRVASGDLRKHLQVLVRQQLLIRVALVDGLEHLQDRLGLALGPKDRGPRLALGAQDVGLSLALGGQDL